jgi:dTDP-glucose 4,6-dehydratase
MSSRSPRLLVTGGAGFIGTNFVRFLRRIQPRDLVVVLDALTYAGNRANLDGVEDRDCFKFVHADIREQSLVEQLLRENEINTVVHFAAESHVDRSIVGPDAFIDTNVVGTHSLLKACRAAWLTGPAVAPHRFHHISTDEVYGSLGAADSAFRETSSYAPNSPYAATKAASDHLVRAYARTYGLQTTTTNCSNNYGPYQFPEKLIPLMIVNLLEGGSLPVYGDGRNVRDWLFVEDHCRGIARVLSDGRVGETYNIGGGAELENLELVRRLCGIADEQFAAQAELRARFPRCPASRCEPCFSLLRYVDDRPGHDRRYAIDSGKIERELGYTAATPLDTGLRQTFNWYVDNEAWWREIARDRNGTRRNLGISRTP